MKNQKRKKMFKICPKCNFTNDDYARHCYHCGCDFSGLIEDEDISEEDFDELEECQ